MIRYFENTLDNMRDVGGKNNRFGDLIITKKILRSELPNKLSDEQVDSLYYLNIKNIIDLRNDDEIKLRPDRFASDKRFNYYHFPLADGRLPKDLDDVYLSYKEMLESRINITNIFEILACSENGILYHCTAGKDRTGVLTMLILKTLDVDDELIVKDYVLSAELLKKQLEEYARTFEYDISEIITPNASTMYKMLDYIKNEFGGIQGYLNSCGITDDIINKVRNKYIIKD